MSVSAIAKRFTGNAVFVLIARIVALVAVFGLNAVLARSLLPADFGVFILFFSLAGLCSLLGCVGLNRALVKKFAETQGLRTDQANSLLRQGLVVALTAGSVVASIAAVGSYFMLAESSTVSLVTRSLLFAGIILARTIHLVLAEAARGLHERIWANLFGGPAGGPLPHLIFLLILLVAETFAGSSLAVALLLYLAAFVVTLPILWWRVFGLTEKLDQSVPHGVELMPNIESSLVTNHDGLVALGVPLMLTQACGLAMSQADIWIAGAMAVPAAIAAYAAAQRMLALLTIPLQIAGTAIVNLIPELVANNKPKLQSMVAIAAAVGGIPGIGLAIIFMAFAEPILGFVFGEHYQSSAGMLRVLTIGQLVCLVTGPCEILLMMAGQQNTTLRVNIAAAITLLVLGPIGILTYGMIGLAAAISIVTASQNIVNWYLAKRLLGITTDVSALVSEVTFLSTLNRKINKQSI